jgi:hypothetical protein
VVPVTFSTLDVTVSWRGFNNSCYATCEFNDSLFHERICFNQERDIVLIMTQ